MHHTLYFLQNNIFSLKDFAHKKECSKITTFVTLQQFIVFYKILFSEIIFSVKNTGCMHKCQILKQMTSIKPTTIVIHLLKNFSINNNYNYNWFYN